MKREFWEGRRVLVTGHTGFKGSWLSLWLDHLGAMVSGLALPPDDDPAATYPALSPWPHLDSHFVDLRDRDGVASVISETDPEVIFHLGAQALVRRGFADPVGTYAVNVLGTAHVLDAARAAPSLGAVVTVTSDKVYANVGDGRAFREDDPLGGSDPYSSSKACADLVAEAFAKSFLLRRTVAAATARSGNVIGGGDRGEDRLLPDVWRALEAGRPVRLRYPGATRPWQFVLEPLYGYLLLAERLVSAPDEAPMTVNFGPSRVACVSVAEVVDRVLSLWGEGTWDPEPVPQPPEAQTLMLDASRASELLGWHPRLDLDTSLGWTVEWWAAWRDGINLRKVAERQIESYEKMIAS